MRPQKLLYVLADGARARLVERSSDNQDFVTFLELDGRTALDGLRAELRASPPPANRQSGTTQRHTVGPDRFVRREKEAFVREVADAALKACRERAFQGVVVAAPPRLIGPLRAGLAEATVSAALEKDLTKVPDSSLGRWLGREALLGTPS